MSKFSSPSVALFVDGYDLTPALVTSISHSNENLTEKTNSFGWGAEGHSPIGITRGVLVVGNGVFDKTIDPLHAAKVPDGGVGVSRVVCVFEQGQTKGVHFTGYAGVYSQKSDALPADGALTKANVAYVVDGAVDDGVIVQEAAPQTADWNTASAPIDAADDPTNRHIDIVSASVESGATSVITTEDDHHLVAGDVVAIFGMAGGIAPDINDSAAEAWQYIGHTVTAPVTAKTFVIPVDVTHAGTGGYCVLVSRAGGGYGYQQLLDGTTFTAFVGTLKHSVDGSTWATLVTFSDTGTVDHDAQRVATATATTQVRRYLAYYGDGANFAASNTVMAGFSRGGV